MASNFSGILLLDKAQGVSSARAIAQVKRKLNLQKIGHAGTLDPMATGLLVCLIGRATRCATFAEDGEKCYSGAIRLGRVTDTDDVTGVTLQETKVDVSFESVVTTAQAFIGKISQIPPQYSAIKLNGERAYERARRGEATELKAREVEIRTLDLAATSDSALITFRMTCSCGTYVRSLARDLGEKLGCGACLESLRREGSVPFKVTHAKTLDEIQESDLMEWSTLFPQVPKLRLNAASIERLYGGDQRDLSKLLTPYSDLLGPASMAIYGGEERGAPGGVLLKKSDQWVLGVNV